jgi:hypothetical protein
MSVAGRDNDQDQEDDRYNNTFFGLLTLLTKSILFLQKRIVSHQGDFGRSGPTQPCQIGERAQLSSTRIVSEAVLQRVAVVLGKFEPAVMKLMLLSLVVLLVSDDSRYAPSPLKPWFESLRNGWGQSVARALQAATPWLIQQPL